MFFKIFRAFHLLVQEHFKKNDGTRDKCADYCSAYHINRFFRGTRILGHFCIINNFYSSGIENTSYLFRCYFRNVISNSEDLQEKLEYLLRMPQEVKKIGEKAKQLVSEQYSWNRVVEQTLELYSSACEKKK